MSYTRYDPYSMTIELVGEKEITEALKGLEKKTPAVIKNAVNTTAQKGRKLMVKRAKARYAVNAAGKRHLDDLQLRKKATVNDIGAELHIGGPGKRSGMKNDLGYFQTNPSRPYMGREVQNAPKVFKARVLRSSSMSALTEKGNRSKGFLVRFKSGHVGMVQRVKNTRGPKFTVRGFARWEPNEKLVTMGSPSAVAMHRTVWQEVQPDVRDMLEENLEKAIAQTLARAAAKGK